MISKFTPSLLHQLDQLPEDRQLRIIVRYRHTPPVVSIRARRAAALAIYRLLPFACLELPVAAARELADDDNVEQIWPDQPVHIWLDASVPLIGVPRVWADGKRGHGVVVAVVDTGVDSSHPDLTGRVALTQDFSGEGFQDNHGHGTHVAGIIAGSGTSSGGRYTGVAPEATLIAAKVLRSDGSGNMSDVMSGVEWAVEQGARVINLSLGADGSCDGTDALSQICDAAVERGAVVCVAAGNAGPAYYTIGSPGCARRVITVGASDPSDYVASFSSRGPTADKRPKPDICFPGVTIASCRARGTSMGQVLDEYYTAASGTSMATPHCSGAAALLLEATPARTPQEIKDLLMSSAKDLGADWYTQGRGRAQVDQAYLGNVTPPPPPTPTPEPPPGCTSLLRKVFRVLPLGRHQPGDSSPGVPPEPPS